MKYATVLLLMLCITQNVFARAGNDSLGLSPTQPVKVGTGVFGGPANERIYLLNLADPKGRELRFKRKGSCCQYPSANAPLGYAMLDIYMVGFFEHQRLVDSSVLYLSFYDYERPVTPPAGFTFVVSSIGDSLEVNKETVHKRYGDSKSVRLTFDHLKSVPDYIYDLTHIEELFISYNELDSLSGRIGQLRNLKKLEFQSNKIKRLPETVSNLTELEEVFLCNKMDWDNVFRVLSKCKKLKRVVLDELGLDSIPGQIVQCQSIGQISLKSNPKINYQRGFEVLGRLKNLKELTVDFRTEQMPAGIKKLQSLEVLNIEHAEIKTLSDEVALLPKLRELHFRYCRSLKTLPSSVGRCRRLSKLSLYSMSEHFDFETAIASLKGLDLTYLDLSQSWHMKIPVAVFDFTNLRYLGLNIYETDSIPDEIGKLTQLETILLGPSNFKSLPKSFGQLQSLKKLDLSGRVDLEFEALFDILARLGKLEEIDLAWGEQRLPDNIAGMKSIRKIIMDNYAGKMVSPEERERHKKLLPGCTFVY